MKLHLFFLNALMTTVLVLYAPVAMRDAYAYTEKKLNELSAAGLVDLEKTALYARENDEEKVAQNMLKDGPMLVNWLTSFTSIRNYLIVPSFFVCLANSLILLRMLFEDLRKKNQPTAN